MINADTLASRRITYLNHGTAEVADRLLLDVVSWVKNPAVKEFLESVLHEPEMHHELSGYVGLVACNFRFAPRFQSFFTSTPSMTAMTTWPWQGFTARSTSKTSPSSKPASRIEAPRTRIKYVASGCLMSILLRSTRSLAWSSAGDGCRKTSCGPPNGFAVPKFQKC